MSSLDLRHVFDDLVRVETAMWNAVNARLGERHKLTLARFEVMQVIAASPQCRVLDIADRLATTWSGASKVVDRIAAAGHCERRPNPADARSSPIIPTRSGRAVLRTATRTVDIELDAQLSRAMSSPHSPTPSDGCGSGCRAAPDRRAPGSGRPVARRKGHVRDAAARTGGRRRPRGRDTSRPAASAFTSPRPRSARPPRSRERARKPLIETGAGRRRLLVVASGDPVGRLRMPLPAVVVWLDNDVLARRVSSWRGSKEARTRVF